MEGRCESDRGRDEVYPAAFGDEEEIGLKLDMMMMIASNIGASGERRPQYSCIFIISKTPANWLYRLRVDDAITPTSSNINPSDVTGASFIEILESL